MAKPVKGNGYAVITLYTDDNKKIGEYKEDDYQSLSTLKTRHNELKMTGLNKTGDTASGTIRGR